jgi:NAD dependent epimerase/dehydratase family enzyme
MRTAVVLHKSGGALKPMILQFRAGLGRPIGDGRQYFPTISLNDWVRAATFLATTDLQGRLQPHGTEPDHERGVHQGLGRMLNRPTLIRRRSGRWRFLGELSNERSAGRSSRRPPADGFVFEQPTLNDRLASAMTT